MDNNGQSRERVRASDWDKEINQATDLAVTEGLAKAAGAEGLRDEQQARENVITGREKAQRMGWRVIDGGRKGEQAAVRAAETKAELLTAAGEIARDETELVRPERFVGDESKIQIDEHKRDDAEDARNEAGMGPTFENRIVAKNQEGVAKAVTPEVDKLAGQKSFQVSDLVDLYRKAVNKMLGVFNRRIGDRN